MIEVKTADGLRHVLDSEASIAHIDSPNTRAALREAYEAGRWEPYEPPQAEPEPEPPDWSAFRLALVQSTNFRAWSEQLPDSWREDLKMAALVANAEALQSTYNHCKTISPPGHIIAEGWQEIADANRIPVTF